ncbi:hypothetical protein BHE74_00045601 [Ensete ventricosum]|nr:hypothetical protein BHE74_00045601 [Ensete ventricosum]
METTTCSLLKVGRPMITLYAEGSSTTMKGTMRVLLLGSLSKVIERVAMPTGVMTSLMNPVKVKVMGVRSHWTTHYDIYLPHHGAFGAERQFAWLPHKLVEMTTDKVFDLVLQIIALIGVVTVVTVEVAVAPAIMLLGLSPYRVGGFEESFLPDLEEDLGPCRVEWSVGEPGDSLLDSFRPLP